MRYFIALFVHCILLQNSYGQKESAQSTNVFWWSYSSIIQLNKKLFSVSDFQIRTKNGVDKLMLLAGRTSIQYKFSPNKSMSLGLADFVSFNDANRVSRNEYRFWEELNFSRDFGTMNMQHRIRTEQRLFFNVQNGKQESTLSNTNNRFRYKLELRWSLTKEKKIGVQALLANELMINSKNNGVGKYFDQNRTTAGLNFKITPAISLQLVYMYILQQRLASTIIDTIHLLRFSLFHTISKKNNDKNE